MDERYWLLSAAIAAVMTIAILWTLVAAAKRDVDRLAARVPEVDEDE